jgi:hypothetical protein
MQMLHSLIPAEVIKNAFTSSRKVAVIKRMSHNQLHFSRIYSYSMFHNQVHNLPTAACCPNKQYTGCNSHFVYAVISGSSQSLKRVMGNGKYVINTNCGNKAHQIIYSSAKDFSGNQPCQC